MLDEQQKAAPRPSGDRRRVICRVTAGFAAAVAALYLVLLVLVADAEAGRSENTFGSYLFLAIAYLVGAVLLAVFDNRLLYLLGVLVQAGVITLFVLFGIGVFGPGLFEYEALEQLHMAVWAGVITGAELVLLGSLSYLAATARHAPGGTPPRSASI